MEGQVQFRGGQNLHQSVNSNIVNSLLKPNDGRGRRPNLAIWNANYASAKTLEHEASISSIYFCGKLLFTCF